MSAQDLHDALEKCERAFRRTSDESDDQDALSSRLAEAVYLMGCMRRLIPGRSASEIYKAFGAPGDFGYGTPIGSALDRLYRAPAPVPSESEAQR